MVSFNEGYEKLNSFIGSSELNRRSEWMLCSWSTILPVTGWQIYWVHGMGSVMSFLHSQGQAVPGAGLTWVPCWDWGQFYGPEMDGAVCAAVENSRITFFKLRSSKIAQRGDVDPNTPDGVWSNERERLELLFSLLCLDSNCESPTSWRLPVPSFQGGYN